MTDVQFQILDELYFVTSYKELALQTGLSHEILVAELDNLKKLDWVKVLYPTPDQESELVAEEWVQHARECFYLATKAGLFAHNGR